MTLDVQYRDLHPEVLPGRYVMISVTDTGEGMPSHVLERVFEPFFTTKEVGKGSGLGLSMVYGFVKQSQGHVAIYSEPGLGTTVRLYLAATDGVADPADAGLPEIPAARGRGETVLLAEDDAFVRSYAVACLESLGYSVIATVSGSEALDRLEKGAAVDILFTDIVMPGGMNGWELAERAERLRPGLKVLLTSGYDVETLTHRGNARANRLLLNKPYRKAELALRLREVMET
jgi:CheY-like chemotaxis protein